MSRSARTQADQASALGVKVELTHYLAAIDEALRQAHHVEDLERAGVNADRPALQRYPIALVDDAGVDAAGQQFGGQYQPDRADPRSGRTAG